MGGQGLEADGGGGGVDGLVDGRSGPIVEEEFDIAAVDAVVGALIEGVEEAERKFGGLFAAGGEGVFGKGGEGEGLAVELFIGEEGFGLPEEAAVAGVPEAVAEGEEEGFGLGGRGVEEGGGGGGKVEGRGRRREGGEEIFVAVDEGAELRAGGHEGGGGEG